MKLHIPIILSAILLSCGNSKEVTSSKTQDSQEVNVTQEVKEQTDATYNSTKTEIEEKKEEATDLNTEKSIEIKAHFGEFEDSDPINIQSVLVSGNTLILTVSYSGGCEEHSFDMVGSQFTAKSLPPIRQLKLIHKNNGDKCKAIIGKTILVDIRDMADVQETGSEIILNLEGWKGRISYKYQ